MSIERSKNQPTKGVHVFDLESPGEIFHTPMASASLPYCLGYPGEKRPCFIWMHMPHDQRDIPHSHPGWTSTFVLGGSGTVGGIELRPGQMVIVGPDSEYGPLVPGPQGITVLEIFEDESTIAAIWDEAHPIVTALYASMGGEPYFKKLARRAET